MIPNLPFYAMSQYIYCTCGRKKSRRVLEKWPRIATTARVMPEK